MNPKPKSDYSSIEDLLKTNSRTESGASWFTEHPEGHGPAQNERAAPAADMRVVVAKADQGLMTRIRAAGIRRDQTIDMLEKMAQGQLEAFAHQVDNQVILHKTRSDVDTAAQLEQLATRELDTLRGCRIRNEVARGETLLEVDKKFKELLDDARAEDLPESWRADNIKDIAMNRARLRALINEDLGSRHRHKPE